MSIFGKKKRKSPKADLSKQHIKWHKVEYKLPPYNTRVLVYNERIGAICIEKRDGTNVTGEIWTNQFHPTHWSPMPLEPNE